MRALRITIELGDDSEELFTPWPPYSLEEFNIYMIEKLSTGARVSMEACE